MRPAPLLVLKKSDLPSKQAKIGGRPHLGGNLKSHVEREVGTTLQKRRFEGEGHIHQRLFFQSFPASTLLCPFYCLFNFICLLCNISDTFLPTFSYFIFFVLSRKLLFSTSSYSLKQETGREREFEIPKEKKETFEAK